MSATLSATTAGNIHPGDLSPNELITFDAFGWLLPDGLTRRKFERLARLGKAPAGVRYTPRSKMVWKAGGIAAWINAKEAAMDVAVVDVAAEFFSGRVKMTPDEIKGVFEVMREAGQ